jgi:large subunit ribosomal protein L11
MQIKNYNQLDINKISRKVALIIPAQTAKLGPPVGPVLGQVKIKVKDFCSLFNEATSLFKVGLPLRVIVFVFKNETFNFIINPPSNSFLLKNSLKFSNQNVLTVLDIYKISLIKKQEFEQLPLTIIFKNLLYTAKLLKIKVVLD